MNNNYLLSLVNSVIPMLAIGFVGMLLLYKIYIKIRSKFNTAVNCWFCNQNSRVPYLQSNSWTCPKCEQYNGFTKDGDYNREIFQQLDCSNLSGTGACNEFSDNSSELNMHCAGPLQPRNGFCEGCNEAQRLKVEKLAQFEPKNESHFEDEIKVYQAQLEEQYRLCSTCNRHLNKVLREKKKMVLGSKFLDFIIKGAENLKQPHFNNIRCARTQLWKRRCSMWTTILTVLYIGCLLSILPTLNREALTMMLGETLGTQLFIVCSHILALSKVVAAYFAGITTHPTAVKVVLLFRTLFMMVLFSLGLKWPQIVSFHLSSLYVLVCPFVLLCLSFAFIVVDSFKLTRFTFLLAVWSVFAGGQVEDGLHLSKNVMLLIASITTLLLSATSRNTMPTTKLHDDSASSFHKIYSEDYFSDEDTLSILSQHLNCSSTSIRSMCSNTSYRRLSASPQRMSAVTTSARLVRSPLTSSVRSLNQLPTTHAQLSPNASFKSFCKDNNDHNQTVRSQYATSMCDFPNVSGNALPRSSLFSSNLELGSLAQKNTQPLLSFNPASAPMESNLNNSSFIEPHAHPLRSQRNASDESFYTSYNSEFHQPNSIFPRGQLHNPLASPFSVSSSAVYQHQQRVTNLLTPSRFSTNCLASNGPASSSWLSGGYFNQRNQNAANQAEGKRNQQLFGHRSGMTAIDENLSRASSQSSGFESQNGRPANFSRENSLCADAVDTLQSTLPVDNVRGFQPIEPNGGALFSPRLPMLSAQSTLTRPLITNCTNVSSSYHNDLWSGSPTVRNGNGFGGTLDSFNLRKINEELPTIRRGDLLRKWKESQALS